MSNDSNSALLNLNRLTATSIPSSQFEDPNLLGISSRASSLASPATPALSALAASPADIDIEAIGVNWIAQGPAPANNGQPAGVRNGNSAGALDNQVIGAIKTVVADPNDANNLWVGTVNGGIWRTNNALTTRDGAGNSVPTERPTWVPLTDQFRGLSIGAMALDPTDGRAIVAGIGHYSSYKREGGALIGLLLSTDGGDTFTEIGLRGLNISGVAKRGDMILASTDRGVYRGTRNVSTGEWTFNIVADTTDPANPTRLDQQAFDLVGDPTDPQRFYAAVAGRGIFRSTDNGLSWTNFSAVDNALQTRIGTNNVNTKIAVSSVNGRVYVGVIQSGVAGPDADVPSGNRPVYIGFRDKEGTNWTQMDLPITLDQRGIDPEEGEEEAGGQGALHFSIVADHTNANIVYVGGDRQRLFRGNTTQTAINPGGQPVDTNGDGIFDQKDLVDRNGDNVINELDLSPQWQTLFGPKTLNGGGTAYSVNGTNPGSIPHADSRHLTFDRQGNLIEVSDGGIYRRTNPNDNTGDWFSLNGNLQITEQHDIAYDTVSNILISGNQDNGTTQQTATQGSWNVFNGGDGGDVAVSINPDNSNQSVRYFSRDTLKDFSRQIYDATNQPVGAAISIPLTGFWVDTNGNGTIDDAEKAAQAPFRTSIALNAAPPNPNNPNDDTQRRLIVAGNNRIFESRDQGNTGNIVQRVNPTTGALENFGISNNSDFGSPIAYGGQRRDNTGTLQPNPNILYVGSSNDVYVRTAAGGNLVQRPIRDASGNSLVDTSGSAITIHDIRGITLDNQDWQTAFAIDDNNVFRTTDAGVSWTDITGDLFDSDRFSKLDINRFANPLGNGDYLASIKFIPGPTLDALVVGTTQGVFASLSNHWGDWFALAPATQPNTAQNRLPHVPVWDIDFANTAPNAPNGLLAVGTLGRGAWTINNINTVLNSAPRPNGGTSYTVNEGSSIVLSAAGSSDPNGLALTYTWDLDGDGIFGETGTAAKQGNEVGINPTFSAAELNGFEGSQSIVKLRVTNSEGSSAVDKNIRINIKNVAPTINGLTLSSTVINENDTITLTGSFNDPGIPDNHKITINWGDGTTSVLFKNEHQLTRTFQLSHQYLDDSPSGTPSDLLPITVTVDDFDGGIAQASTAIRVNNIAPVITSFTSNANFADRARAGKPITVNANFTDIGTLDTHRAFVDWGDGTPTQEVTIFQGRGSGAVQGSHTYAKGGAFTVKLTLNDDDTGIDTASLRTIIIGTGSGPG